MKICFKTLIEVKKRNNDCTTNSVITGTAKVNTVTFAQKSHKTDQK